MLDALSMEIERSAKEKGSYIDAILEFQKSKDIDDVEDIVDILHPIVVEKIKIEFIKKNFLPDQKIDNSISSEFFGD